MANLVIKKNFVDGDKLFAQQLNNNFETIEKAINDGNKIVWQDGTEVKFKRYVTNDIDSLPILDGSIIYDTAKGRQYIDYKGQRIQVGSAGKEVIIQETEPTEEDNKIWIDSDVINTMGTEIINEHSDSSTLGYSANYLNGKTIVESGSNDKGSYVKFGDGTMIQRGSVNCGSQGAGVIIFPQSFINEDNDMVANQKYKSGGELGIITTAQANSTTSGAVYFRKYVNGVLTAVADTNVEASWFAIGKWK